ncbi:MAG: response regulator [Desulfobacteraceae bacterium]|uniref:Response regulator n=1 Tax=Candidatus Desulfaltia bathyphila TaxID=2841697 RepID=A0A8J6N5Q3_9BACT|nr:response regulator [Candidatus Desulfaltia bathyphila]MBL7196138.1 response regulator [Desulfobacterales bacterium]
MKKILIVDDQKELLNLIEATLSMEDYHILKATNGKQAIDIARTEKPDMIIMDIMMPGKFDGLEATRVLKNDPQTSSCPIVLLSAKTQMNDIKGGLAAGADDYFTKPFSPLELIKKVEEVLG